MQPEFTLGAGDIPDHMIPTTRRRKEDELLSRPGCPECERLRAWALYQEAIVADLRTEIQAIKADLRRSEQSLALSRQSFDDYRRLHG